MTLDFRRGKSSRHKAMLFREPLLVAAKRAFVRRFPETSVASFTQASAPARD